MKRMTKSAITSEPHTTGRMLTQELVDTAVCPAGIGHIEVPDQLVRGFFLDVLSSGLKCWRLRFTFEGRRRVITLGDTGVLGLDEARFLARDSLRALWRGEAPQTMQGTGGPSLRDFFLGAYLDYVKGYKRSWATDESVIRNHLVPALGNRPMGSVQAADVANLISQMKAAAYAAGTINRVLVLLSYGYRLALRWKTSGVYRNPAAETEHLKVDNRIERYLTEEETQRLLQAVRLSPNAQLGAIVAFLILTGARKREALTVRWADIDLDRRLWRISRTKSGKNRHVPLSDSALKVLLNQRVRQQAQGVASTFVFPNEHTGQPFVSVFYSWDAARRRAGLEDLRMHDLRHSFASFLVNAGRSLYEVQELLGHADARTTSRYAHLSPERLRQAVQVVGDSVVIPSS